MGAQQGLPRPHPRGGWLRSLREDGHGVVEDQQGQALPQVLEEAYRLPHPRQEEEVNNDIYRLVFCSHFFLSEYFLPYPKCHHRKNKKKKKKKKGVFGGNFKKKKKKKKKKS